MNKFKGEREGGRQQEEREGEEGEQGRRRGGGQRRKRKGGEKEVKEDGRGGKFLLDFFAQRMTVTCDLWWRRRATPLGSGKAEFSPLELQGPEFKTKKEIPSSRKRVGAGPCKDVGTHCQGLCQLVTAGSGLWRGKRSTCLGHKLKGAPKTQLTETNMLM